MKKRILYIEANRDGTIGGSYYSLLYLLQGLNKDKYEPHVLFCQDNALIPEFKKVTPYVYVNDFGPSSSNVANGMLSSVIKWPYRLVIDVILKQPRLLKIIKEIQPDLVHLNNGYSTMHEWMLACRLSGIKVVAHDRGTRSPCSFRTKLFVRLLDAIICVSESYKQNVVKQHLRVRRVCRIYNGLDPDAMALSQNKGELKKEFHVRDNQPLIGIVGNIDRWKGQIVVLKAVNIVKNHYPNIKCLIVGAVCKGAEGYKEELDKYIDDNELRESITFTGFRKDIPDILNILDIFIHSSIEPEPFGRVILEAMAMGVPVIATDAGGPTEIIENGVSGILVPMNDSDSMAEAVAYLLSNPEATRDVGEKGKQRLKELFSTKRMVGETEKAYEEIFGC